MDKQLVISIRAVVFTFLLALAGYVLYRLGTVFGILLVALLIVISVEPVILYVSKQKFMNGPITRGTAVIFTYLLIVIAFIAILTIGLPPILLQIKKLVFGLSHFLNGLNVDGGLEKYVTDTVAQLSDVSGGVISTTVSIFQNITTLFSLLIISIYISLDWPNIKEKAFSLLSHRAQDRALDIMTDIENNISAWIKGQLFLMLAVGVVSFAGLFILGIDYAPALGLVSGLLEFVPMIGPIMSAVLAGVIGFSISPVKGFGVIVLFTLIQQLENNILVPKVMQKVSGFSPLVILFALLIGSEFFGIMGAVLAVPIMMIGYILIKKLVLDVDR